MSVMKTKVRRRRISFETAVTIVCRWHSGDATQGELAREYGVNVGHVSKLCHGDVRPDVYEAAKQELESGDAT